MEDEKTKGGKSALLTSHLTATHSCPHSLSYSVSEGIVSPAIRCYQFSFAVEPF